MTVSAITTTLSGGILLQSTWNASKKEPINSPVDQASYQLRPSFTNGSGANEMSNLYHARLAVSSVTPGVSIDLSALLNPFNDTWSISLVKELLIVNLSTVSGDKIIVGAAGSNPWVAPFADSGHPDTATMTIGPSGWWHLPNYIDGYAVSGGSKILKFLWDGISEEIDFDVIIKGN